MFSHARIFSEYQVSYCLGFSPNFGYVLDFNALLNILSDQSRPRGLSAFINLVLRSTNSVAFSYFSWLILVSDSSIVSSLQYRVTITVTFTFSKWDGF